MSGYTPEDPLFSRSFHTVIPAYGYAVALIDFVLFLFLLLYKLPKMVSIIIIINILKLC